MTNVFEFLETVKELPLVVTVERTSFSKYCFFLVVRHYRKKLRRTPQFVMAVKGELPKVKASMEEHSLWGDRPLFVLEGFPKDFVDRLNLPDGTYVVAETNLGELKATRWRYKDRRDTLKILTAQLGGTWSLRELIKLDWSGIKDFDEVERLLRKGRIMEWTEPELGAELETVRWGNILERLKRSQFQEIFQMMGKYGPSWTAGHIIATVGDLVTFKALENMGLPHQDIVKQMDLGPGQRVNLQEAAASHTMDDLRKLAQRLVDLHWLMTRSPRLGLELFLLNAPTRVRK